MSRFDRHRSAPLVVLFILELLLHASGRALSEADNVTCIWVPVVASATASPGTSTTNTAASTSVSDANDTAGSTTNYTATTNTISSISTTTAAATTTTIGTGTSNAVPTVVSSNDTDDNSTDSGNSTAGSRRLEELIPAQRRTLLSRNLQASNGYWNCTAVDQEDSTGAAGVTTATPATAGKNTTLHLSNSTNMTKNTSKTNASNSTTLNASANSSGNASKTGLDASSPSSNAASGAESSSDGCTDAVFCSGHGTVDGSSDTQCSCVCEENWGGERCSIFIDDAPSTASSEVYEGGFKTSTVLICGGCGIGLVVALGIVWTRFGKNSKMAVMPEGGDSQEKKSKCPCVAMLNKAKEAKAKAAERAQKKKELAEKAKGYLKPDDGKGEEESKAEGVDGEENKDADKKADKDEAGPKDAAQGSDAPNAAEAPKEAETGVAETKEEEKKD